MTSQASTTHSYDSSSWSSPSQLNGGDDVVAERLRQSTYDPEVSAPASFNPLQSQEFSAVGPVGAKAVRATTMSDVHEYSFNQIATGSDALEQAHIQAFSKFTADIGDIAPKKIQPDEIAFSNAPAENAINVAAGNDAIWGAVCESVFKQSARPLTVLRKRQEASDAAALKCVEEGDTHHPPVSSRAEHMAFAVTAQADQTYGTSRAKFAALKVGEGAAACTISGAIHSNAKGTFFKTPQDTYQMKFQGDRLALQQPDGQLIPSELLGRRRSKEQETPKDTPQIREHYLVQSGETSSSIASKLFNNDGYARLVEQVNKLPPDSELLAGMKLQLPTHTDLATYVTA